MTRDYSSRRARARVGATHQFLIMTIAFVFGYVTASFVSVASISQWINDQVLAHKDRVDNVIEKKTKEVAIVHKPKFEFYTLLTNEKTSEAQTVSKAAVTTNKTTAIDLTSNPSVEPTKPTPANSLRQQTNIANPSTATKTASSENRKATFKETSKATYLVQVAAFKSRIDAEQMKGVLTLKGFNVYIIPLNHPTKGNWFRVVVGPYKNRQLAQKDQALLVRHEHLHGMIVSMS